MKRSVNENINRLRSLMGLLNEDLEDTKTGEENGEEKTPQYGPNAIFAKIPCNYKNGRNAFQLQSNEDYSFNDGYTYYLLPSKFESGGDPQMNADTFNYGESTNDGRTVIAGTYTLLKVKDNSEIFEGKPFNAKRPPTGGPLKPETGSWTELINDAKSWTIDLFFEDKDSTLKSIYSDMSNFLNPTIKTLTHQGVEPTGWGLNDVGNISSVDRFKDIPEVTTATEYMLDINSDGKITFFIRNPRLKRLIPIWDGNQLTFKKATGSEKHGEIIITTPKVEESKFRYKKNLLNEDTKKTGCIKGDCKNGYGTYTWSDGTKYVGNWKDGSQNGYGTKTYPNGTKYVGNWKDSYWNGYGTITYDDGTKYVGNFKDDKFNGYGTYTWPNGTKYVGNFKDDEFNGYGTKTWPNGDKYVGNWKDDNYNGYGTITWSDGTKYVGNWKDNKHSGYGTYTNSSGCEYSGEWIKGKLNGKYAVDYDKITNCTEKPKEKPKPKSCPYQSTPFENTTEGNEFRAWVRENFMDYAKVIDLSATGEFNNCHYIRKAYANVPTDYSLSLGEIYNRIKQNPKLVVSDFTTTNYPKTKEKSKENEINNVVTLEQKPTKFEIQAEDVFFNLIQGKIPNVTIVSYTEPILDEDGHYDYVYLKAKINNIVYDLNFSPLGLNIQDSAGNHKKAVWDNKNLTVRNFTKEEKKDAEEDYRLLSDIQFLGGDKFQMEETLKRFKQLIK